MIIGIDIGTTNVKSVALNADGTVCAEAERQNTILSPQPGYQEQDPEAVFQLVVTVLAEVWSASKDKETLQGVVFSSAMHGLLAVDKKDKPLTNILLWSDMRADAIARSLRKDKVGKEIYQKTGVPIHAMSPLCKLLWLQRHEPAIFQRSQRFVDIKSYIWYRLTGAWELDISVASATGLLNILENDWDRQALKAAGISSTQLPKLVSPAHTAQLEPGFAAKLALPGDVPYIIGASDGALANLGSGATQAGQVAVTIGTSAAIRTVSNEVVLDDSMRTFCYRLDEERCIVGGASNNGTNTLEWLRQVVLRSDMEVDDFANQALEVPAAADGVLFLPYLLGERAPLYSAQVTGGFQGLTVRHGQAHFVRAVMEGVLFNVKVIAEALETHGPIKTLHAGGGFSHNALWVQMLADIFQKTVVLPQEDIDASILGAVLLARQVLGLKQDAGPQNHRTIKPNKDNAQVYQAAFEKFKTGCKYLITNE